MDAQKAESKMGCLVSGFHLESYRTFGAQIVQYEDVHFAPPFPRSVSLLKGATPFKITFASQQKLDDIDADGVDVWRRRCRDLLAVLSGTGGGQTQKSGILLSWYARDQSMHQIQIQ